MAVDTRVGVTVPAIALGDGASTRPVTTIVVSAAASTIAPPVSVSGADMIVPADMAVDCSDAAVDVATAAAATGGC